MSGTQLKIRPIEPADEPAMARIIRTVMPTFGAVGPGYAINDPEVDFMCRAYQRPGAAFFVIEATRPDGSTEVVGGGGVAPLDGSQADERMCELRKMYFLPEARGQGMGAKLLGHCLRLARELGYRRCYLETLEVMEQAIRLYDRFGFERLSCQLGHTGHHSCDRYYARSLEDLSNLPA